MKKILIVEDDLHIQDIFKIIFKSYGYQVECIDNGETLIEMRDSLPDIIILDKQLPGINGVEACQYLKNHFETRDIPVIMISATSGIEEASVLAGANDYLEKPFNMHTILKKVSDIFKASES